MLSPCHGTRPHAGLRDKKKKKKKKSSFDFTPAYASSRSATVGFLRWDGASHRFEVVAGSVAHLARYHT